MTAKALPSRVPRWLIDGALALWLLAMSAVYLRQFASNLGVLGRVLGLR